MVFFSAHKHQRLAEILQRVQKAIEEAGGDLEWVEEELAEAARVAGFDLEIARLVDGPTLETVLGAGEGGAPGRCWLAAETLFADGLVAQAEGREEEARDRLEKARRLYGKLGGDLHLPHQAASLEERLERIGELLG